MTNILHEIGRKYGTDKSTHVHQGISYLHIYDRYFNNIRHNVKSMLEIGVKDGRSLRMWQEYFPNAFIYGMDINPASKAHEDGRIKIIIGDQNDDEDLQHIKNEIGVCDIILDDGSHMTDHQIKSFNMLYDSVPRGGFYVIEDLRNSYEEMNGTRDLREIWSGMEYNKPDDPLLNKRTDFNEWMEAKIKNLDDIYFKEEKTSLFALHYYQQIIIFENFNN